MHSLNSEGTLGNEQTSFNNLISIAHQQTLISRRNDTNIFHTEINHFKLWTITEQLKHLLSQTTIGIEMSTQYIQ